MRQEGGFWRAALVGALAGVVVVSAAIIAVRSGVVGKVQAVVKPEAKGMLLALVLPAGNGTVEPRVIVYYPPGSAPGVVVDPRRRVAVPGSSADRLLDAYAFGGGGGLASAYGQSANVPTPTWVLVDASAWAGLASGRTIDVTLSAPMDVFNGVDLVSLPAGSVAVDASQTAVVLSGADYLRTTGRNLVLAGVASGLQHLLVARGASTTLLSDTTPEQFAAWQRSLASRGSPELFRR